MCDKNIMINTNLRSCFVNRCKNRIKIIVQNGFSKCDGMYGRREKFLFFTTINAYVIGFPYIYLIFFSCFFFFRGTFSPLSGFPEKRFNRCFQTFTRNRMEFNVRYWAVYLFIDILFDVQINIHYTKIRKYFTFIFKVFR